MYAENCIKLNEFKIKKKIKKTSQNFIRENKLEPNLLNSSQHT